MKRKILAYFMTLALVLSMVPASVFADGEQPVQVTASLQGLNRAILNQPLQGLAELKVKVQYATGEPREEQPTAFYVGDDSVTADDITNDQKLKQFTSPYTVTKEIDKKVLYAYYQKDSFKELIELGGITVNEPLESITLESKKVQTAEDKDYIYGALLEQQVVIFAYTNYQRINATAVGGTPTTIGPDNVEWVITGPGYATPTVLDLHSNRKVPAGTFTVKARSIASPGVMSDNGPEIVIEKGKLNVRLSNKEITKTYGEAAQVPTVEVSGFALGENADNADGYTAPSVASDGFAATAPVKAEGYPITVTGTATNYTFEGDMTGKVTVNPKEVTISKVRMPDITPQTQAAFANVEVSKQASDGEVGYKTDDIVNGDDIKLSLTGTYQDLTEGNDKAVVATATLKGDKAANYTLKDGGVVSSVTKVNVTQNVPDEVVSVGDIAVKVASITYGETLKDIYEKVLPDNITVNFATAGAKHVAKEHVKWFIKDSEDQIEIEVKSAGQEKPFAGRYELIAKVGEKSSKVDFNVLKKQIKIKANDAQMVYGAAVPNDFTATVEGTIDPSRHDEDLLHDVKFRTNATSTSKVTEGNKTITPYKEEVSDPQAQTPLWKNYEPTFENGQLTISKKPVDLKDVVLELPKLTQGAASATEYAVALPAGFKVGNDTVNVKVTLEAKPDTAQLIENKEVNVTASVLEGADAANYEYAVDSAKKAKYTVVKKAAGGGGFILFPSNPTKKDEAATDKKDADKKDTDKKDSESKPTASKFADVNTGVWYEKDVEFVADKKLMLGTEANKFSPNQTVSRGMIAGILYRLAGSPKVEKESKFSDVAAGDWHKDMVVWATENGVASGYGNGMFGPNDNLERQQLVTVLYNYSKKMGYDVNAEQDLSKFADASSVAAYADMAMKWAVKNGIITGKDGNMLAPAGVATRAELATIIKRYITTFVDKNEKTATTEKK